MTCGTQLDTQPADTMMAKDGPFRLFDVTGWAMPAPAGGGDCAAREETVQRAPVFDRILPPPAGFPYSSRCSFLPPW